MSWKSALTYLKANLGHDGPKTADQAAPLNARIGGIVQYQQAPFLKALAAGTLFDLPNGEAGKSPIRALSHVRLEAAGSIWRLHEVLGDPLNDDSRFIQLYVNEQGELVEALACSRLASYVPDPDELPYLIGEAQAGLGDQEYTLDRDTLRGCGLTEAELTAVLADAQTLVYTRDIQGQAYVAPLQGTETRIDDPAGQHGLQADIWFMPYTRTLRDGSVEYLLIQLYKVLSQDGNADRQAVYVQIWVGIPLEKERVTVL